ncbi:MAG: hypothetical protein AAGC71_00370 [Pseudomonadota bacterium]
MSEHRASRVLAAAALLLTVLPPFIFSVVALTAGMTVGETLTSVAEQYSRPRVNLAVLTALGFVPLLLLGVWLAGRRLLIGTWQGAGAYAWSASVATLLIVVFMHSEYWPTYLPARVPAGFPHGLEFTIGPFVFGPIAVVISCIAVALYRRSRKN